MRFLGAAVVALLCGCASTAVKPKSVLLCRQGLCEAVVDAPSRERLLTAIHGLLKEADGKEVPLYTAAPDGRGAPKRAIGFFVQGGPFPARCSVTGIKISDVLFIDREKAETKARIGVVATFMGVPLICNDPATALTVLPDQIGLNHSSLCTWAALGTTMTKFQWNFDRVDLDAGTISGPWAARTAGLPVLGGGSGYMMGRFREATLIPEASPPAKPDEPPAPPIAKAEGGGSQAFHLTMATRLEDGNSNRLLEGGEGISLTVKVANEGGIPATEVRVELSGEAALTECLGQRLSLGTIKPGKQAEAEFKCDLPARVPSETVTLKVEVQAGPNSSAEAAKVMRVGMKAAAGAVAAAPTGETASELSVDEIPPRSKSGSADNAAVVVGLSRYRDKGIPAVKYAARDAEVMARYLENVAGVPSANLKLVTDENATKSDLEANFEDWLPRRARPDSTVFVYFAGHGTPDATGKEAFIVPFEGHPDFPTKLYPLKRLYDSLAKLPAKNVVVMLDSCFSGAKGRGLAREGARPLILSIERAGAPGGRIAVLAGATGSQIASDLDSAEHGLFTYFLLKGMRGEADADRDGEVDLGELYGFVRERVSKKASLDLNRDQTPVLLGPAPAGAKFPITRR